MGKERGSGEDGRGSEFGEGEEEVKEGDMKEAKKYG